MGDVSEKAVPGSERKRPRIELQTPKPPERVDDAISKARGNAAPLPAKLTEFLADLSRNCQRRFSLQTPSASSAAKDLIPEPRPIPPAGRALGTGNESRSFQRKVVKVQNLPPNAEESDLVKALQHRGYFGNISYVELLKESHSAYVEFENGEAAAKCLRFASNKNNSVTVNDNTVQILATNKGALVRRSVLESEEPTSVLFLRVSRLSAEKLNVRHVHGICAEASLTEFLVRIAIDHVSPECDEVFIEFSSPAEATRAKFLLNGQDIFPDLPATQRCTIMAEFANMAEVDIPQVDDDHFDFSNVPALDSAVVDDAGAETFMTMEQVSDDEDDALEEPGAILPKPTVPPSGQSHSPKKRSVAVVSRVPNVAAVHPPAAEAALGQQKSVVPEILIRSPKLQDALASPLHQDSHSRSSGSSKDSSSRSGLKANPKPERPVWPKRKFGEDSRRHVTNLSRAKTNGPISERQSSSANAASWTHQHVADRIAAPRLNAVVEVNGIDSRRINCDHLFNLMSQYGNVHKIIFHVPRAGSDLNNAKVQMGNVASAVRVVQYLENISIFRTPLRIKKSRVNFVVFPNNPPRSLPDIDSSPTFKNFANSPLNRFRGVPGAADTFSFPESSLYFVASKGVTEEQIRTLLRNLDTSSPLRVDFLSQMALPLHERSTFVAGTLEFRTTNKAIDALALAHGATIAGPDGRSYPLRLSFLGDKKDKSNLRVRLSPSETSSRGDSNANVNAIVEKALAYSDT